MKLRIREQIAICLPNGRIARISPQGGCGVDTLTPQTTPRAVEDRVTLCPNEPEALIEITCPLGQCTIWIAMDSEYLKDPDDGLPGSLVITKTAWPNPAIPEDAPEPQEVLLDERFGPNAQATLDSIPLTI